MPFGRRTTVFHLKLMFAVESRDLLKMFSAHINSLYIGRGLSALKSNWQATFNMKMKCDFVSKLIILFKDLAKAQIGLEIYFLNKSFTSVNKIM